MLVQQKRAPVFLSWCVVKTTEQKQTANDAKGANNANVKPSALRTVHSRRALDGLMFFCLESLKYSKNTEFNIN